MSRRNDLKRSQCARRQYVFLVDDYMRMLRSPFDIIHFAKPLHYGVRILLIRSNFICASKSVFPRNSNSSCCLCPINFSRLPFSDCVIISACNSLRAFVYTHTAGPYDRNASCPALGKLPCIKNYAVLCLCLDTFVQRGRFLCIHGSFADFGIYRLK